MRRLPPPAVSSVDLVTALVADRQRGKNRDFFNRVADEWRTRVAQYINQRGSPATIGTWAEADGHCIAFQNLYLSPKDGQAQHQVLLDLRAHKLTHCPACGEPGGPNTLDHYLPKTTYPHFSVEPHNLVPMCDACQGKKLANVGDIDHPKFFVHPYFDTFVDQHVVQLIFARPLIHPPTNSRSALRSRPSRSPWSRNTSSSWACTSGLGASSKKST